MRRLFLFAAAVLATSAGRTPALAQIPTSEQLQYIEEFSSNMCEKVKQEGSASSEKFQGDLKAGLSTFFKKFFDTGASGTASYTNEKYEGVLQKDLASALQDTRQCKTHFGDRLIDLLKSTQQDEIAYHIFPGNEDTPQNSCSSQAPPGSIILFLGTFTVIATKFPHNVLTVGGEPLIKLDRNADRGLSLYVKVYSKDGREIVRIENNRFVINQNNYFGITQPAGRSSLDFISKDEETVLKVRYLNESAATLEGHFRSGGISIPIGSSEMRIGTNSFSNFCSIASGSDINVGGGNAR